MDPNVHRENMRRDAESLLMKGAFFTFLGVPVLIGTFWAKTSHAATVNVGAGVLLLIVGLGFIMKGFRIRSVLKQ